MEQDDFVKVVNVGKAPWNDKYDGKPFQLDRGGDTIVPFGAACLWFGHPDAVDVDERNRHRTDEWARIRVRYGIYEHTYDEDGNDLIETRIPKVEVWTLDGRKLSMVCHDPDGDDVTMAGFPSVTEADNRDAAIEAMQAQMARMQRVIDDLENRQIADDDGDADDDEDDSEPKKVAAAKKAPAKKAGGTVVKGKGQSNPPTGPTNGEADEDGPNRIKGG